MTHNERIYIDYAATTPLDPRVLSRMMPYLEEFYGNPNSIHRAGRRTREAIEEAREVTAAVIGASPHEVFFTGCGSESNNLVLRGVASARRARGRRLVVSAIEHPSILATCAALERDGVETTVLPVDGMGRVDPDDVSAAIQPDTVLVSIMHANNEVGTIQPVHAISDICRSKRVYFHSDAVQTTGKLSVDVQELGVDLLSMSGHKFYGPKGTGALYVRSGVRLSPQITGGGQETDRRSGTENVAGIVGLAEALRLAAESMDEESQAEQALRDRLLKEIPAAIPDTLVTGDPCNRLSNHSSFCFRGVEGEAVLLALDRAGVEASAGSACSSGSLEPPHALQAMGVPAEFARGSLRLSLGRWNTDADIDTLMSLLPPIVERLRSIARPLPG